MYHIKDSRFSVDHWAFASLSSDCLGLIACLPFASQRHDDQRRTVNLTVVYTYALLLYTFFKETMFSQQSSIHSLRTVASAGAIVTVSMAT